MTNFYWRSFDFECRDNTAHDRWCCDRETSHFLFQIKMSCTAHYPTRQKQSADQSIPITVRVGWDKWKIKRVALSITENPKNSVPENDITTLLNKSLPVVTHSSPLAWMNVSPIMYPYTNQISETTHDPNINGNGRISVLLVSITLNSIDSGAAQNITKTRQHTKPVKRIS